MMSGSVQLWNGISVAISERRLIQIALALLSVLIVIWLIHNTSRIRAAIVARRCSTEHQMNPIIELNYSNPPWFRLRLALWVAFDGPDDSGQVSAPIAALEALPSGPVQRCQLRRYTSGYITMHRPVASCNYRIASVGPPIAIWAGFFLWIRM